MILMLKKLSVAAASLLVAGCTTPAAVDANAGRVSVATAFYPLTFVAEAVGGELVEVHQLTTPGTDPHDAELTPRQVGAISQADLVVYLGGFQPSVDESLIAGEAKQIFDVATAIELLPAAQVGDHDVTHDDHESGHDDHGGTHDGHEGDHEADQATHDDHAADEHEGGEHDDHEGDHGHDHAGLDFDPHFWLDPIRYGQVASALAEQLATIDPANAETYRANAKEFNEKLTVLDAEFSDGLANCDRQTVITSHTAFGYWADRYGLNQVGIAGLSTHEEPSPTRIAEIQQLATKHGVTTIFFEALTSDAIAKSIAHDLGLETAVLDPLEGLTTDAADADYFSIMSHNLATLRAANGCS